ncbi:hypothetical protein KY347_00545 [Candidatus Woesearchaeota archaeon]|nr:hypothetical protein [Candidatus Woesearchaeota archaeon]
MNKINSFLAEWGIRFLENKDAVKKEITGIEKNNGECDFVVHYKEKARHFIVMPLLEANIFNRIRADEYVGIITLNNEANIKFAASEWKRLSSLEFLIVYFVNPFSGSGKVWAISPHIHDKICDKSSLELGLNSMAEMVEPISLEELKSKCQQENLPQESAC